MSTQTAPAKTNNADNVKYDPSDSSLTSDNVQDAIDELDAAIVGSNELSEVLANGNTTGGTDIIVSSGDSINAETGSNMPIVLGDDLGATEVEIQNKSGTKVAAIDSKGNITTAIGQDGVNDLTASGTSTNKMNSNGDSYVAGGNLGAGTKTPIAQLDIAGSMAFKVRTIAAATGTLAVTDNFVAVDHTTTAPVALDLPPAADAWNSTDSTGIVLTVADINANAGANNITVSRVGSDTIIDTEAGQTSTAIQVDGGVMRFIPINSTTWKVL